MSIPVFYHSGMAGFPAGNTRTAGGLIAVLDACLVNGANLLTAVTLTQAGGVATATFAGNHNFAIGDSVEVSGATPTAYNGRKTVTAKTVDAVSFAVDAGTASPATGTVQIKHPGAGWSKTWSDGNAAAYRSATSDGGVGAYMQIEDNNPYTDSHQTFRWRACEGHTGLDTATRLATPGRRFFRSADHDKWWVVADDRTAYVHFVGASSASNHEMFAMGEIASLSPTDSGAWMFPGHSAAGASQAAGSPLSLGQRNDTGTGNWSLQLLKPWAGFDVLADASPTMLGGPAENPLGGNSSLSDAQRSGSAPNPLTGAVELVPVRVMEKIQQGISPGSALVRGVFPGAYQLTGKLADALFDERMTAIMSGTVVNGTVRKIMVARCQNTAAAQVAFDLTGPWR